MTSKQYFGMNMYAQSINHKKIFSLSIISVLDRLDKNSSKGSQVKTVSLLQEGVTSIKGTICRDNAQFHPGSWESPRGALKTMANGIMTKSTVNLFQNDEKVIKISTNYHIYTLVCLNIVPESCSAVIKGECDVTRHMHIYVHELCPTIPSTLR